MAQKPQKYILEYVPKRTQHSHIEMLRYHNVCDLNPRDVGG